MVVVGGFPTGSLTQCAGQTVVACLFRAFAVLSSFRAGLRV